MITSLSVNRGGLGRFGNQLFTIAGTIGIAVKNGQPFGFPEWINRDNALFGGKADVMSEYFIHKLPELIQGVQYNDIPYHWEYRDYYIPTGNWNICSHLQDERYFIHAIEQVRHYFTMKDEPPQNDYVAIHYRAGDYIDDPNAYHPRCSKEYYEQSIKQFPDNTKFIVFTDDNNEWMKIQNSFMFPAKSCEINIFSSKRTYIESFRLMKRCKSFITANSSFSLMAAILGDQPDKKIICPKRWFGSQASIIFEGYPENAIVI